VNEELSLRNLNDSISVGTVVFLGKDKFGEGDEEFSRTLTSIFLQTMYEAGHRPRAILLANTGVRLLAKDSSSHKVLSDFKAAGVEVWACGLCVEYYKLKNEIPIEQITNMFAICEYIFAADRLVTV
jgi:intracellular sulfur oxidation DsrE/DsrF family protein